MKRDSKLSIALHILTHLATTEDRPIISGVMSAHLGTNPVVVRRSLAGLRDAGIVASVKGHGGGWALARPAAAITLGEVYAVLGEAAGIMPRVEPDPDGCRVDAVVQSALNGFYDAANALLRRRLETITLADLAAGLASRFRTCGPEARTSDLLSA